MDTNQDIGLERRGMLRALGSGAATAAVATTGAIVGSPTAHAAAPSSPFADNDLFNFALNFEYLGAEYYLHGLTGQGLSSTLTGGSGAQGVVIAGPQVPFQSSAVQQYVQRLAVDEQAHVQFVRAAISANGGTPVAEPQIDLVGAWNALALAAGLIVPGQSFNPYANDVSFLIGAYVIEDVCVTALAGAARFITNPNNLEAAAGLLGVEGYQAGAIRSLLADLGAGQVTDQIAALRATLSGIGDQGVVYNGLSFNFTNTDVNALVYRRTPRQVLNIAYGAVNASSGGFFPNGVNGNIRS